MTLHVISLFVLIFVAAGQTLEPTVAPSAPVVATEATTVAPSNELEIPPILSTFPTPQGGNQVCSVCGEGKVIAYKDNSTDLGGDLYSCADIEAAGNRKLIPDSYCDIVAVMISPSCGCIPSMSPGSAPYAMSIPPTKPVPVATISPTTQTPTLAVATTRVPLTSAPTSTAFEVLFNRRLGSIVAACGILIFMLV